MVRRRCKREGCRRTRAAGKTHCTQVCSLLDIELSTLESVRRFAGLGPAGQKAGSRLAERQVQFGTRYACDFMLTTRAFRPRVITVSR
jgi:hypothetical protein